MIACSEDGITNYGDTLLIVEFRRYRSPPSHITELFVQLVRCHHNLSDHGLVCEMCRDGSGPQLLGLEPRPFDWRKMMAADE